jgi:hypothetical protein
MQLQYGKKRVFLDIHNMGRQLASDTEAAGGCQRCHGCAHRNGLISRMSTATAGLTIRMTR